ncbi:MAG: hypothetical protein SPL99_04530 [Catonella sp.]|nr:hypothetical protein [Catonella sp.]MDY6357755.1 hypothetical protein [Catonella sp.]
MNIGIKEEWMSLIIILYSLFQMLSEKILNVVPRKRYRILMLTSATIGGVLMMAFAIGQSTLLVLIIMVIMPLFLDLPYYVESEMVNKYIDRYNKQDKRATILSVMNMGGNILEVIFLLASACIANIGISVCFIVSAVLIIILSAIVFLLSRSFYQDESENS